MIKLDIENEVFKRANANFNKLVNYGFMKDKNYREIINILMPKADHFYCVTPPDTRGLPAEDLTVCLRQAGARAHAYRTTAEALHRAQEEAASLPVIVFGSLYLAGEIRDLIGLAP